MTVVPFGERSRDDPSPASEVQEQGTQALVGGRPLCFDCRQLRRSPESTATMEKAEKALSWSVFIGAVVCFSCTVQLSSGVVRSQIWHFGKTLLDRQGDQGVPGQPAFALPCLAPYPVILNLLLCVSKVRRVARRCWTGKAIKACPGNQPLLCPAWPHTQSS